MPDRGVDQVRDKLLIGVVGKGRNCPESVLSLAAEVGELVGRHSSRCILVTGGLGGAMDAASVACSRAGGLVVGLLPAPETRTTPATQALDLALNLGVTPQMRNVILAAAVDAMIAVPGSHGALQEMIAAVDLEKATLAVGTHPIHLPDVEYLPSLDALERRFETLLTSKPPPD